MKKGMLDRQFKQRGPHKTILRPQPKQEGYEYKGVEKSCDETKTKTETNKGNIDE